MQADADKIINIIESFTCAYLSDEAEYGLTGAVYLEDDPIVLTVEPNDEDLLKLRDALDEYFKNK